MTSRSDGWNAASRAQVATRLARALQLVLSDASADTIARGLRRLASDIDADAFALRVEEPKEADPRVQEVYAWWREKMALPAAKLTPGRARAVAARLRDGYSVDDLRLAVSACASSPWHMGENDRKTAYNDLAFVCRNGEKVEAFLQLARRVGLVKRVVEPQYAALERQATERLQKGDWDAYNRINDRLVALERSHGRANT